jgi:hypothetical protein
LPQPVRTAVTATTGLLLASMPSSLRQQQQQQQQQSEPILCATSPFAKASMINSQLASKHQPVLSWFLDSMSESANANTDPSA